MKKSILFTLFLSFLLPAVAQVNAYFENNPVWHVERVSYSGWDCSGTINSGNYTLAGDTVVNSLTYKKVVKQGLISLINSSCEVYSTGFYQDPVPLFYLRSLDKKMYIYLPNEALEYLLYDFDLEVGDTLPESYTYNSSNHTQEIIVESIDSVQTPNGWMKRFELSEGYALFEGAGSTGGLDEPVFPLFLSGSHTLLCYSLQDTTYFPQFGSGTCFSGVGLSETEVQQAEVYPNPFTNETTIHLNSEVVNARFNLYTINGVLLQNLQFSGNSMTLKRGDLPSGIYFYRIAAENKETLSGRIIIQ